MWENITRDYANECNVVYHADDFVCNYMICYYSETPRVYERIKSIVRCKMMHSRYVCQLCAISDGSQGPYKQIGRG